MYANGEGVAQDYAEALKWYLKAADGGNVDAQSNLEALYATAMKKWETLSEEGNAKAHYNLGKAYAEGAGVIQDTATGHMWFTIAALKRYAGAAEGRDNVAKQLTAEQLEKANDRAKRCMASNYKECDAKAKSWWQKLID